MFDSDDLTEYLEALEPEEIVSIIGWAIATGSILTALVHSGVDDPDDIVEYLEAYTTSINVMFANMPEILLDPAIELANEVVEAEESIALWTEELSTLNPEDFT